MNDHLYHVRQVFEQSLDRDLAALRNHMLYRQLKTAISSALEKALVQYDQNLNRDVQLPNPKP